MPACPIPIHHTKLTMAKPQPTGMLIPQMPVPRTNKREHRKHEQVHKTECKERSNQPAFRRVFPGQVNDACDALGDAIVIVPRAKNDVRARVRDYVLVELIFLNIRFLG